MCHGSPWRRCTGSQADERAPAHSPPLTFASVSVNPYIDMPEGSYRFQVGAICCTVLSDGYFSYPMPWFFPNADPNELSRALDRRHLPQDAVLSPYTCLLVETGEKAHISD